MRQATLRAMSDIAFEIRMQLLRVGPNLSLAQADDLIAGIPQCYAEISLDNRERNSDPEDYYDFSLLNGVVLATIFREAEIEVFAFRADESLIRSTNHLAMVDVAQFFQIARRSFSLPEAGLRFPLSEALPWLQHH